MINIINCSPKVDSNTSYFINKVTKKLQNKYIISKIYFESENEILEKIEKCNILLLVFPLYVDAPPSKLINLIEKYDNLKFKKIYAICNCGFLESKHNDIAIKIIENWCFNSKGIFMGSFKIGAGEVIRNGNILSKIISPLFNFKINKFTKKINQNKKINIKSTIILSKSLYCYFGNKNWNKKLEKCKKI